jgi:hypothetical protein
MLNLSDLQVDTATISNINMETNDDPTTSSNKIDSNNFINTDEITPEMMSIMMMKNKQNGNEVSHQTSKSLFNDSEDAIFITND